MRKTYHCGVSAAHAPHSWTFGTVTYFCGGS